MRYYGFGFDPQTVTGHPCQYCGGEVFGDDEDYCVKCARLMEDDYE